MLGFSVQPVLMKSIQPVRVRIADLKIRHTVKPVIQFQKQSLRLGVICHRRFLKRRVLALALHRHVVIPEQIGDKARTEQ